jgi:hypothetical protein
VTKRKLRRIRRLHDIMLQYSIDSGSLAIPRPVEQIVLLRMMTVDPYEREAILWRNFGSSSLMRP